jgi:hypothetical protein
VELGSSGVEQLRSVRGFRLLSQICFFSLELYDSALKFSLGPKHKVAGCEVHDGYGDSLTDEGNDDVVPG